MDATGSAFSGSLPVTGSAIPRMTCRTRSRAPNCGCGGVIPSALRLLKKSGYAGLILAVRGPLTEHGLTLPGAGVVGICAGIRRRASSQRLAPEHLDSNLNGRGSPGDNSTLFVQ